MTEYDGVERSTMEQLRALLDKRGVKHIDYEDRATWWSNGNVECAYIQTKLLDDKLGQLSFIATPEQAVEATLGAVHRKTHTKEYCNRCEGAVLPKWKKCPWCGEPLEEV